MFAQENIIGNATNILLIEQVTQMNRFYNYIFWTIIAEEIATNGFARSSIYKWNRYWNTIEQQNYAKVQFNMLKEYSSRQTNCVIYILAYTYDKTI